MTLRPDVISGRNFFCSSSRRRSSSSGSKNHRTALYCRRPTFLVAAVRKSASEVPLRACNCKRNFKDAQPPFHSGWRLRWFDCSAISLTLCRTADAVSDAAHRCPCLRCCASVPFASLRTSSAHSRGRLASSAEIPYCVLSSDQAGRRQIWRQGSQIQPPNRASASSRLRASSMPKPPLRVRRRLLRKAPLPRASPRSRASARI